MHNLEVGKMYIRVGGYKHKIIHIEDGYIYTIYQSDGNPFRFPMNETFVWKEYIPDRWVVLTYVDSTRTRAETSAETFPSEQAARDRSGSSPLFAGVAKLENVSSNT